MHEICCLFSLVRFSLKRKTVPSGGVFNAGGKTVCGRTGDSHQTLKNHITVGCFAPWCNVSRCLIWHSAATQLLSFVTFCGPSAPVPPIVPEFSIFGQKLDSLNLCVGHCDSFRAINSIISTVIFPFAHLNFSLNDNSKRFNSGGL